MRAGDLVGRVLAPALGLAPAWVLLGSFAAVIAVGAGLLSLPASTHQGISWIDALFISTSAVCVTGLATVDPGSTFTGLGQLFTLALVQTGGLGIVFYGTVALLVLGRRVPFRVAASIRDTFATLEHGDVSTLVKRVVVFVLAIEAVGALLLLVRFSSQFELPRALWLAVFHAVSAFCNAGFSLFPDGLIGYAEDPLVVLTVGTLIVLGGIGFVIQAELWERLRGRRRSRHLSLHARTALFTSGVLIALGAVGFYALEREGALRGASWLGHLLIPLFSAVTPRTAGFNTIDFGALREVTLLGVIVLMFIGASPGSTGGGIKTTTLAVLARFLTARLTSRQPQHLFDRSVPMSSVLNAFQILGAALGLVVLATGALALTEEGLARFLDYAFEATSAFGTVGLSTGITPKLSTTGKLVLVAVMFLGRTGPLLLVIVAARSAEEVPAYRYPEEEVMIG